MQTSIVLHRCPKLGANILPRHCDSNQVRYARSIQPGSDDVTSRVNLKPCGDCPGVLALHAGRITLQLGVPVLKLKRGPLHEMKPARMRIGRYNGPPLGRQLTTGQVSQVLGCSRNTVQHVMRRAGFEGKRHGLRVIYTRKQVESVLSGMLAQSRTSRRPRTSAAGTKPSRVSSS